jgi:SSS family solute:Na+ symporter
MTKAGAISSIVVGFAITAFWLLFVKVPEINAFKLVSKSILAEHPNWPVVDPLFIALPISALTAVVVSLFTTPPDEKHLERCFGNKRTETKTESAG